MSISTLSVRAADGLPPSQQAASPARATGASAPGELVPVPASQAPATAQAREADKPDAVQLQQSLEDINQILAGFSISVQFEMDPDYKDLIVKVVDQHTGQLIRQMPTEDVVRMSKAMENLKGLLFFQSA